MPQYRQGNYAGYKRKQIVQLLCNGGLCIQQDAYIQSLLRPPEDDTAHLNDIIPHCDNRLWYKHEVLVDEIINTETGCRYRGVPFVICGDKTKDAR